LTLLDQSAIVRSYVVHEYRHWSSGSYYKIAVWLKDSSVLHIREYATDTERNYSFHWQDADGELKCRWDNAPHHSHLDTYPHHRHDSGRVLPSRTITLGEVLGEIEHGADKA
jgi:hypothetical protein